MWLSKYQTTRSWQWWQCQWKVRKIHSLYKRWLSTMILWIIMWRFPLLSVMHILDKHTIVNPYYGSQCRKHQYIKQEWSCKLISFISESHHTNVRARATLPGSSWHGGRSGFGTGWPWWTFECVNRFVRPQHLATVASWREGIYLIFLLIFFFSKYYCSQCWWGLFCAAAPLS